MYAAVEFHVSWVFRPPDEFAALGNRRYFIPSAHMRLGEMDIGVFSKSFESYNFRVQESRFSGEVRIQIT